MTGGPVQDRHIEAARPRHECAEVGPAVRSALPVVGETSGRTPRRLALAFPPREWSAVTSSPFGGVVDYALGNGPDPVREQTSQGDAGCHAIESSQRISHATIGQEYFLDALSKKYHETVTTAPSGRPRRGRTEADMKAGARSQEIARGGDRPSGRAGGSDPVERIKDMDIDGVEAEVLHCVVAGADLGYTGDAAMQAAFVHGENEARRTWCATDPQRLIPVAVLPLENIDDAVTELEWLGREGFRAVEIPVYPDEVGLKPYGHESWAPLWNVASDLKIPLHLHVGTNNGLARIRQYDRTPSRTISQSLPPIYMAECISSWILPGTFDRHPGMKVLLAEAGVTWNPVLRGQTGHHDGAASPGATGHAQGTAQFLLAAQHGLLV